MKRAESIKATELNVEKMKALESIATRNGKSDVAKDIREMREATQYFIWGQKVLENGQD